MFRIPCFYQIDLEWAEAVRIVKGRANGDLLEGMKAIDRQWDEFLANERAYYRGEVDEMIYGDENDFYEHWQYEVNAFNVVYEGMSELFAPKKVA